MFVMGEMKLRGTYSVFIISFAVLFILFLSAYSVSALNTDLAKADYVRVIVDSKEKSSLAIADGCTPVKGRENDVVKSYDCLKSVPTKAGLMEDIPVQALDIKADNQIRANFVWKLGDTGQGRKIVILDTGYNYNHPDLAKSYLGGYDFVNGDNDPMDDNGHGSHVAGLIVSQGISDGKSKGVAPGAKIIAAKVLDVNGNGYFSDIINAIYWAVNGPDGIYGTRDDFHPDVISISIGTAAPYVFRDFCDDAFPPVTDAIKYAVDRNVTVVVAAGNSGFNGVSLPGCVSYALTVGAIDSKNQVAGFSGNGAAVDILAPGVDLYSTWLNSGYNTLSGTSMAAPIMSGVVALMKEKNPNASPAQIETTLKNTDEPIDHKKSSLGIVNAFDAVKKIAEIFRRGR